MKKMKGIRKRWMMNSIGAALLVVLLDGLVAALLGPNLTALYALVGF